MVSSKRKNKIILQALLAFRSTDAYEIFSYLRDGAIEKGLHFAGLYTVLDIGLDPVLHIGVDAWPTMHHRYPCTTAPEFERSDRSRILRADDRDVSVVERMWLLIIVKHLG